MVLDPHRWLELRRFRGLLESGALSLSEIARETGLDRKTVRKYLSSPGPATPPRRSPNGRSRARVIDEFAPLVDAMLRAEVLMKAAVIHERLVAEYGFTGNYQRVKLYVQEARPRVAEELGITPKELAGMHRRFEVIPGAQAWRGRQGQPWRGLYVGTTRCSRGPGSDQGRFRFSQSGNILRPSTGSLRSAQVPPPEFRPG